ncbi:MAG: hypothetical protein JWM16_485, partial [Verrucomicrobiales bacterium]|nr:hypothetical protein [Verrucomicrobiales bacterium]
FARRESFTTSGQPSTGRIGESAGADLCGNLAVVFSGLFGLVLFFPILNLLCNSYEPDQLLGSFCLGLPTFLGGHVLAFLAGASSSEKAKRKGKKALLIIWGSIALFILCLCIGVLVVGLWASVSAARQK